jgi:hypothetical protein
LVLLRLECKGCTLCRIELELDRGVPRTARSFREFGRRLRRLGDALVFTKAAKHAGSSILFMCSARLASWDA